MYKVAKPFKTDIRKFAIDADISRADVTGPTSFDDWMKRGFITEHGESSAAKEPPKKPSLQK